jgi:hypothetical protein
MRTVSHFVRPHLLSRNRLLVTAVCVSITRRSFEVGRHRCLIEFSAIDRRLHKSRPTKYRASKVTGLYNGTIESASHEISAAKVTKDEALREVGASEICPAKV